MDSEELPVDLLLMTFSKPWIIMQCVQSCALWQLQIEIYEKQETMYSAATATTVKPPTGVSHLHVQI